MNWRIFQATKLSDSFVQCVHDLAEGKGDRHLAQLLWQRDLADIDKLPGFLNPDRYQPTSAFDFGQEMKRAMGRLVQARAAQEKIAIWGDFDADGVTATSVLWEGLGQFLRKKVSLSTMCPIV